ncbi:hypothetical protein ACP275_13G059800 [Erythranthe tilingii]
MPRCIFNCRTLVEFCVITDMGGAMCLPRLKKLRLISVQYDAYEFLTDLLSGSPVIEELVFQSTNDFDSCRISSSTLKRLTLDLDIFGSNDLDCMLELDTPALVYLRLVDMSARRIKYVELTSLVEANIDIYNNIRAQGGFIYSRLLVELIYRLRNVKCLKLVLTHSTEIIGSLFSARNISFRNLTNLDLTTDCPFLSKFLENADNLKSLTLQKVLGVLEGWTEPQQVPTCLISHLRTVKLVHFVGSEHKFRIVKYLLRNTLVLERMEIVHFFSLNPEQKISMIQEISLFQRGSKACEVAFV